jgi:predicted PurR-regulated permease PerM
MEQKGIKRTLGIIIIYLIFLSVLILTCFYIIPMIVKDIGKLISDLPGYSSRIRDSVKFIEDKYSKIGLPDSIKNIINNNVIKIQNYIVLYLESVVTSIISFFPYPCI